MGIWIRSQNKERLININEFWIVDDGEKDYYIIQGVHSTISLKSGYTLGRYKTKEGTIDILNDIQRELININPADKNQCIVVYEMPQE